MYNINDQLTLSDNNKYIIASKIVNDNHAFYYLINADKDDVKFCMEDNSQLVEIVDPELIKKLSPLFVQEGINFLKQNEA